MVYVHDSKWVVDPTRITGRDAGWVMEYHIDSMADLAQLPQTDQIMGSSIALVKTTGQVISLTATGWDGNL